MPPHRARQGGRISLAEPLLLCPTPAGPLFRLSIEMRRPKIAYPPDTVTVFK